MGRIDFSPSGLGKCAVGTTVELSIRAVDSLTSRIDVHRRASPHIPWSKDLTSAPSGAYVVDVLFFQASKAEALIWRETTRFGLRCDLASRSRCDWQPTAVALPHDAAGSRPLPRSRVSSHSVNESSKMDRASSSVAPGRRLGAGHAGLARTLGCSDRTRRDLDRLRAGDAATLLRAGRSGSAPYRRDHIAALRGGGEAITTGPEVR